MTIEGYWLPRIPWISLYIGHLVKGNYLFLSATIISNMVFWLNAWHGPASLLERVAMTSTAQNHRFVL